MTIHYPSSPASLPSRTGDGAGMAARTVFSLHTPGIRTGMYAREGIIYEGVTCPYCLNTEVEAVGGYISDGKAVRIYYCPKCVSNFERTVENDPNAG